MEIITDLTQLREPSEPLKFVTDTGFDTEEGTEIVEKLKATMEENPDIEALSAPQIGINKRIFCIKFDDGIRIFINPILTRKNGLSVAAEKCSSMPGKEILIARPKDIILKFTNEEFKYDDNKFMGYAAALVDQQCQLLDGVTPDLMGLVTDLADGSFYDLSEDDKATAIDMYTKYAKTKAEEFKSYITPEMEKDYKQLKFTEDVINDRIQVVDYSPKNREQRRAAAKQQKKIDKINKEIAKAREEEKEKTEE